jgi:hypothetical protein
MIILRNCQGVERQVEEGVVYYPTDPCERDPIGSSLTNLHDELSEELSNQGIQWGDAIAWVTKSLGISQCTPCKARQEILNKAGTLGVKETIRLIKETF